MSNTLSIVHIPLGVEHPYDQNPFERSPRDPLSGDEVALGVATSPVGCAEWVSVTWKVKDTGEAGAVEGVRQEDDIDFSYWKVQLPAFSEGCRVTYKINAGVGGKKFQSKTFSFDVPRCVEVGDVVKYSISQTSIKFLCSDIVGEGTSVFRIDLTNENALHFQLERGIDENVDLDFNDDIIYQSDSKISPASILSLVEETNDNLLLNTEKHQIKIHLKPFKLEVLHNDGTPILVQSEPTRWLIGRNGETKTASQTFSCSPEEAFYGFGERFNGLNQRGNAIDIRVYEQYKDHGLRTYLPIPFFLSSEGYGFLFETSKYILFDLGAEFNNCWHYKAEMGSSGILEYELLIDQDPKAILQAYSELTCLPTLPPAWVFGPWMSSNEWNSQARIKKEIERSVELEIPATVLVIEAWSDEATFYIWNDAQYIPKSSDQNFTLGDFSYPDSGKWPDPKKMIQDLHDRGLRVLLWQVPVQRKTEQPHPQNQIDQKYMIDNKYCVREENGDPYLVKPPWCQDGLVMDFTSPEATEWWLSKRSYLLDEMDIDGFKTDGGEHIWGRSLRFSDGRLGDDIWNLYPNLYAGAYHKFLKKTRGEDGITFSRSGFTGAQKYPCHWAGDENSTWAAFRASIMAGLNAGLSGIPFWGWDIAGFSGEIPSAELYIRATAMAAFCPIMQYHSEYNDHATPSNDRSPWNIEECTGDEDVVPIFRKYANLRMNLLPYIYSQAKDSSTTGLPIMRSLLLEYGFDHESSNYPYQYQFGDSLLIAPIIQENTSIQNVYLPEGDWYDFWTHQFIQGPTLVDYPTPKEVIPVFVRAGSALALNLNESSELGESVGNETDSYKNLSFMIYPPREGKFTLDWFDLVSKQLYQMRCSKIANEGIEIEIPPIPHDITLIIVQSICSSILVDDKVIPISNDIDKLRKPENAVGFYDTMRKLIYLKLTQEDSRRIIRTTKRRNYKGIL